MVPFENRTNFVLFLNGLNHSHTGSQNVQFLNVSGIEWPVFESPLCRPTNFLTQHLHFSTLRKV